MSKKRVADNYLTDQNWDRADDEEDEKEAATEPFKPASEEILAKRSFKKAARRVKNTDNKEKANPFAAFGGFSSSGGFGSKPAETAVSTTSSASTGGFNFNGENSGFSFKPATTETNISSAIPVKPNFSFNFGPKPTETQEKPTEVKDDLVQPKEDENKPADKDIKDIIDIKADNEDGQKNNNSDDEYLVKLASLNKCLLRWIEKHMDENNCINLTPVFGDYEKHLKEISI